MSVNNDGTYNTLVVYKGLTTEKLTVVTDETVGGNLTVTGNQVVSGTLTVTGTINPTGGIQAPNLVGVQSTNYSVQVLSTSGAISTTTTLVILDNSTNAIAATLANGTVGDVKIIRLLYGSGLECTVTTPVGAVVDLSATRTEVMMLYTTNGWIVVNQNNYMYPTIQQGSKLVGTGNTGAALQGGSVALSADGNTLAVGGYQDNASVGAVWVYTRTAGVWTQQGSKLVGTGAVGASLQGWSVALSADGNTLAVGGPGDNADIGATWFYTRSAGVWTQQGAKKVGSGNVGACKQGQSVALSADGNLVAIGGPGDNTNVGATWIFTRAAGAWGQQGSKLVGSGNAGVSCLQGSSIALSSGGDTVFIGAPSDNTGVGACWVFNRTGTVWTQNGSKLTATGIPGQSNLGSSIACNAAGTLFCAGANSYNPGAAIGAAIVFTNAGGAWAQYGLPLTATDTTGSSNLGGSISMSADGNLIAVGGPADNLSAGAVWLFKYDGNWEQIGTKIVGTGATAAPVLQGASLAMSSNGSTMAWGGTEDNANNGAVWVFD